MTNKERLKWLEQIEGDICVCSLESTFADDAKSCAIRSAIDELEQHRWIPVTERLPEESYDSVIGWDAHRERCVFVQFYNGQFQISGSNETFDIKYWMPMITSPYEGGKEE